MFKLVGRVGVEPTTIRLKVECSTTELPARLQQAMGPRKAARTIVGRIAGGKGLPVCARLDARAKGALLSMARLREFK